MRKRKRLPKAWARTLMLGLACLAGCSVPGTNDSRSADPFAAIEQETGSLAALLARGRNLEESGELEEARQVYLRLVQQYPERPEGYHRLGVVSDRLRRHQEAQQWFTQAIQRDPRNAELFNDLGYCFYLQGKLDKAEAALAKAVRLQPASARYRNNLGLVLGHQGRYGEALQQFQAAAGEAGAYHNLAFVYASQEKWDQAKACLQRALAIDPNHQLARQALENFQKYETLVAQGLEEFVETDHDNTRTVLYREQPSGGAAVPAGPAVRAATHSSLSHSQEARRTIQALHQRASWLLQQKMAQQRGESVTELP